MNAAFAAFRKDAEADEAAASRAASASRDAAATKQREQAARISELEAENKDLENQVLELRNGVEVIEKRENEHKAVEDKKRKDEIDFLKYQGQHLDAFLRQLGPVGGK